MRGGERREGRAPRAGSKWVTERNECAHLSAGRRSVAMAMGEVRSGSGCRAGETLVDAIASFSAT